MLPALMDRLCKESAMLFHPEVMDLAAMADKIRALEKRIAQLENSLENKL